MSASTPSPSRIHVGILQKMLAKEFTDSDLNLEDIAARTEGCNGADLKEISRVAALQRVKAVIQSFKSRDAGTGSSRGESEVSLGSESMYGRPLCQADFDMAIEATLSASKRQLQSACVYRSLRKIGPCHLY